jgi:hypothetical protein
MIRLLFSAHELRETIQTIAQRKLTGKLEINFSQGTPAGRIVWEVRPKPFPPSVPREDRRKGLTEQNIQA